jgi:hypothetical protein
MRVTIFYYSFAHSLQGENFTVNRAQSCSAQNSFKNSFFSTKFKIMWPHNQVIEVDEDLGRRKLIQMIHKINFPKKYHNY